MSFQTDVYMVMIMSGPLTKLSFVLPVTPSRDFLRKFWADALEDAYDLEAIGSRIVNNLKLVFL